MWYINKNETNYECKGIPEVSTTKYIDELRVQAPTSKTKAKRAKYNANLQAGAVNLAAIPEPGLTTIQNKYIDICWSSNSIVGNKPYQETTKKENNMQSLEQNTRDYLLNRLSSVRSTKVREAQKKFRINERTGPISPEDMIRMIKDGLYELPKKYTDAFVIEQLKDDYLDATDEKQILKDRFYWSGDFSSYFTWKDPERTPDQKGYDAAVKSIDAQITKLKDAIYTLPAAEASKLLQEFEAAE